MNQTKKRLRFSKKGNLKFIGHLDFLRVFGEMLQRSRLPVAYSAGFNPHILLSFALPLPLGFESENDYADLVFTEDLQEDTILRPLNETAPKGLVIKNVYSAPDKCASVVVAADYTFTWKEARESRIQEILSMNEIIVPKKTKSGLRNTDIRPDILSAFISGDEVHMRLMAGSEKFLHPIVAADALLGVKPSPIGFTRLEMYKKNVHGNYVEL